jgi:CheY-like chemotaxis protein
MRSSSDVRVLVGTARAAAAQALRSQLESEGCRVDTVETADGVLAAAPGLYDLIFLDLELPETDGLSVLSQLRLNGEAGGTPVVLIKGEREPDHILQRGLDMGASGFVVANRLRVHLLKGGLVDMFLNPSPHEPERRQVPRSPQARADSCPYSARGDFHTCPVFVPIEIAIGEDGAENRTTCSHLRVGTASTWRLYPRCALGDAVARERYLQDLSC